MDGLAGHHRPDGDGRPAGGLTVLAVDDESPALSELGFLLRADPRVHRVLTARSGAEALRMLADNTPDAVFLDIKMPDLSGVDVARVVNRMARAPALVFVTASDAHALDAFDLAAADYLLKPIRPERLREAVRRIAALAALPRPTPPAPQTDEESIAIELAGVIRLVPRAEVRYAQARGDYARLFTATDSHLVRVPLSTLEERWASAGFVRIHRSFLVSLAHVQEVRFAPGQATVVLGTDELPVSRRHTRALRDLLGRRSIRGE
ncbi:MAG TPA: LytTR family DNA-binding domain-containing protein [Sporichthyaceae bacterium]|nr:LytTR family DNA-binding domain-containing protein [Sporichthyaceae bacterium]